MEEKSSTSMVYLAVVGRSKEVNQPIAVLRLGVSAFTSCISRTKREHKTRSSMSFVYLTVR